MKVFIKEICRDVIVRIYGTDGDEHTKEFFERFFDNVEGVYETTDDEREEYRSEGVYTIEKLENYELFAQTVKNIQQAIDEVAKALIDGRSIEEFTIDKQCFVV